MTWVAGDVGVGGIPVFGVHCALCVMLLSGSGIAVSNVAVLLEKAYFY